MRSFLRRTGLTLATGSLVFFLSCERHHPSELPQPHHPKQHAGGPHAEGEPEVRGDQRPPPPPPTGTPAQFFPSASPR